MRTIPSGLEQEIDQLYQQLAIRPPMFSGQTECIEAYVRGAESIQSLLKDADGSGETRAYGDFLGDKQLGMHSVTTRFCSANNCRLGFISLDDIDTVRNADRLVQAFQLEFNSLWNEFLEWRKQK